MTMLRPDRFITAMRHSAAILPPLLKDVTLEQAQTLTDGPDGWCIAEIVGHLLDFEEIFMERAMRMAAEDHPLLVNCDQNALVIEHGYKTQDFREIMALWQGKRAEFIAWLEARSEAEWPRTGVHSTWGTITVLEQAMQISTHDLNHFDQMMKVLGG